MSRVRDAVCPRTGWKSSTVESKTRGKSLLRFIMVLRQVSDKLKNYLVKLVEQRLVFPSLWKELLGRVRSMTQASPLPGPPPKAEGENSLRFVERPINLFFDQRHCSADSATGPG